MPHMLNLKLGGEVIAVCTVIYARFYMLRVRDELSSLAIQGGSVRTIYLVLGNSPLFALESEYITKACLLYNGPD